MMVLLLLFNSIKVSKPRVDNTIFLLCVAIVNERRDDELKRTHHLNFFYERRTQYEETNQTQQDQPRGTQQERKSTSYNPRLQALSEPVHHQMQVTILCSLFQMHKETTN